MLRKSWAIIVTLFSCCVGASASSAAPSVAFATAPQVKKTAAGTEISFTLAAPTDVEVGIIDANNKAVRHLAAGVLGGPFPPPPPLKPGLAQTLTWDDLDDFAKPAGTGPFTIRVRAGTGVKFGRFIGEDPYTFGFINTLTTDEAGNLYATASAGDCYQYAPTLRMFTPDGRYLRTIMPFPASLPPGDVGAAGRWDEARGAFVPRNFQSGNPITYPVEAGPETLRLVSADPKSGVVLTSGNSVLRVQLDGGKFTGLTPMWSKKADLKNPNWNTPQLATSPDGRYVYYANVAGTKYQPKSPADHDAKWPNGRVYRQDTTKPGEDPQPFYDLELPDRETTKYWLPDAWNKRTAAANVTTDRAGHVYVCDLVNQVIVELDADGKKISVTKAAWPERVHVASTGEYYVISRLDKPKDGRVGKKLLRLDGRGADAKVTAEMKLDGRLGEASAVGLINGQRVLWLAGGPTLICVRSAGDRFEPVETQFKPRKDAQVDWARLAIDAEREELYVNNGTSLTYRYNGGTGEGGLLRGKDGKTFHMVDVSVGYDGLLYARVGDSFAGPLGRFTRDLEPAPFPATGTHVLYDIYNRMGIGYSDKGLGAGPRGECYDMYMYDWNRYFVAGFDEHGKAIKGNYLVDKMKKPEAKSANAKLPADRQVNSAVIGPVPAEGGGICVDLAGNIYVGMRLVPKAFKAPPGYEKDPAYTTWTGSIVKFPPAGGTVLGAVKADDPVNPQGERVDCNGGKTVVNALAIYPGLSPFSGGGFGGNSSACVCRVSRFGIDRHARLVYANSVDCSATMIDNAGNPILTFGAYGNFDSQFVNPNLPAGQADKPSATTPTFPLAWPTGAVMSDKHVYVLDTYSKRVLRADKTWAVEATVAVK